MSPRPATIVQADIDGISPMTDTPDIQETMLMFSRIKMAARANGIPDRNVTLALNKGDEHPINGSPQSFIYFLKCNEYIKIGVSTDPHKRMESMTTGNPYEIKMVHVVMGNIDDERRYHKMFAEHRHGREWFRFEGALKEWLEGFEK